MDRYRLRLDTIKLKDASGSEISRYSFSYNSTELPVKNACSQDWWGYYNGFYTNTTLVPTSQHPLGGGNFETMGDADRSAVESYMKAGILEKITYPTGGHTVFETESHKMFSPTTIVNEQRDAAAFGQTSNNLVVTTFTVPSNTFSGSGGINITISPYTVSHTEPFVKIKNVTTGQEQTIKSSDMTQWFHASLAYPFYVGNTYELTASCYVNLPNATAAINASFTRFVSTPTLIPVGGLRIKSIKNYTDVNTLAGEENYRYGPEENGGGVFVGIGSSAYTYSKNVTVYYRHVNFCLTDQTLQRNYYLGGSFFDQALYQGSPVVYTDVAKYYGSTSNNSGKTTYYYGTHVQQQVEVKTLPSGQFQANNQGVIIINNSWKRGQLLRQQDYRKNSQGGGYSLVQSNENIYNMFYTDTAYGLFSQTKFERHVADGNCIAKYFSDYAWAEYPVYTGYVQLSQNKSDLYGQSASDFAQTISDYTYDNTRRDIAILTKTTNSKGQLEEVEKKYPFHKASLLTSTTGSESQALDTMVARNMIAPAIEVIHRVAGTQQRLDKTSFEFVNAATIAPVNLRTQIKSNAIETRIAFSKYDNYGNLTEQSKAGDVKKSYLWDYNNLYPIAEATNAAANEIFFDGFEAPGTWDSPVVLDSVRSHTGRFSARMTNATSGEYYCHSLKWLTVSLSAPTKYKYSGWVYSTGPSVEMIFFMKRNGESGYYSYLDNMTTTVTGKWVYMEKEFTVPADVTQLNIRIDNNSTGTVWYDDIRLHPAAATMVTYTYAPLVGVTSQSDGYSRPTYFEYDPFNRLTLVRNQDGFVLKKICYNYAGQAENCTTPYYTSIAKAGIFTRNNCSPGNAGSSVTYTVPAGSYTSSISQADADQKAQNDVNTNGQAYANANGTCTPVVGINISSYPPGSCYMVEFYNLSTFELYYIYINGTGVQGYVPAGNYDIGFYDMGCDGVSRQFTVCGLSQVATYAVTFYNRNINASTCYTLSIQ